MIEDYHPTQLVFRGKLRSYSVAARWKLISGESPKAGTTWIASVALEPFPPPSSVTDLIFVALSNPSVQVEMQNDEGELIACHISDILELTDWGNIEISSLDLPSAKIIPGHGASSHLEI